MSRHQPAHRRPAYHGPAHRKPAPISGRAVLVIIAALTLAVAAIVALTTRPAAAQAPQLITPASSVTWQAPAMPHAARAPARPPARAAPAGYTVRPGDTLSAIAIRSCRHVNDWTGIYAASRKVIGPDPDLIQPGQHLAVSCTDPPGLLALAARDDARPAVQPAVQHAVRHAVRSSAAAAAAAPAYASAGAYSYAGLEQLWESAGGPSWAASSAASIAECESGGRTDAYNPSGATGLWQILGSVVPGNLDNAYTNALNAVAKFRESGDTFAQWVCQAAKVTGAAPRPGITLDASYTSGGGAALDWAEAHADGLWYAYGTAGPVTYDCSGLVSTAVLRATGIWIGRDTYTMLGTAGNGHLVRTYDPQRGDLAFFGTGHVEFVTSWWHTTFGAHETGTRIGWSHWSGYWAPTAYYRVV